MSTREQAETLAAKMSRFEVPTRGYARPPGGTRDDDLFLIRINRNELRVWPGIAEVTVAGSSKHRQVVLTVTEKARTVTREYEVYVPSWQAPGTDLTKLTVKNLGKVQERVEGMFPVAFPRRDEVKFTVLEVNPPGSTTDDDGAINRNIVVKVQARAKASTQTFLVGYDEAGLFISMLPKKAKSVAEAHKVLRPKGVTNKAIRQGEWFFEPVSDTMREALDAYFARNPRNLTDHSSPIDREYGTHRGSTLAYKNKTYAIGWVIDRRYGEADHHAPLLLHDWHQVIRNTELEQPEGMTGTWD